MTIAIDASSPAIVNGSATGTLTTASFTPPAGSYLVAVACGGYGSGTTTATITDSLSGTWTSRVTSNGANGSAFGVAQISTRVIGSSAAMTVTVTYANLNGGRELGVYVITGADNTTVGASANLNVSTTLTAMTTSLTTTVTGSIVLGGADSSGTNGTVASLAANTAWATMSGTNPVSNGTDLVGYGILKSSALTGTPGAKTYGVTWNSATNGHLALLEIVPATSSTIAGADGTSNVVESALVQANVPVADTGGLADVATVTAPVAGGDTASGADVGAVRVSGAADSGVWDEAVTILAGGSTLKFASDIASSVEGVAPLVIKDSDTFSSADIMQTATVGINGPLPPGPRIVRIGQSTTTG